jgi:surface antigen
MDDRRAGIGASGMPGRLIRQRMAAATRSRADYPRWMAASCICVAVLLLGAMLGCAAVAAARPLPLLVLVRASFSDRGGSPVVNVAIRSAGGAECQLTTAVDKRSVSFPGMIVDARGRLAVSWQLPAGAPGGVWVFDVSCARGQRRGRGGDYATVLLKGKTSTGRLVANSSSQVVRGDLSAAGIRVRADSYASSCNAELCFADDSLWRAAGESTWYAMGRRPDLAGIVNAHAGDWLGEARGREPEGRVPIVGAVAVWLPNTGAASSDGHVAYVAGISGDRVLVEDSNWGEPVLRVHRHLVPAAWISGYIYGGAAGGAPNAGVSAPPPPAVSPPLQAVSAPSGASPGSPPPPMASLAPGLSVPSPPAESAPGGGSPPPPPGEGPSGPGSGNPPEGQGGSGGNPPVEPSPVELLEATSPPTPTAPIPESLTSILPRAQQIMAQSGTVWSKAAAVRNLVRASLSEQNDCGVMAAAFWSVGSIVGLPLRIVNSSANGQNPFDTHATVEVWLAGLGRWAISDPTFNGYWTAGPEGPPVSAEFMQKAMRTGTSNTLYWHGAGTPNSILPSQYYVDPTTLYSYIDFLAFTPSLGSTFMVDSEADAFSAPDVLVPTMITNFESLPPSAKTSVAVYQRTEAPSSAGARDFTLPPSYAGALVYEGQVTVGSDGRVPLPLTEQALAVVVSVDTNSGHWQIEVGGGATYNLDAYPQARVSPMIFFVPPVYLVAGGAVSGPVKVRIWTVKDFPSNREVTSQWDGG